MKTTGTFLFIATFAAFFYSTAAILDLTGTWYVLFARGLKEDFQHPHCWTMKITKTKGQLEGTSKFFNDQNDESVNIKFTLSRYPNEGIDLYNVSTHLYSPLDFSSFDIYAVEHDEGVAISLIEISNDDESEPEVFDELVMSRDQESTESSPIWEFCVPPTESCS